MGVCYYCHRPSNEIILAGRLPGDQEAPRQAVWHAHPCPDCEDHMKQGIILISVSDSADPTEDNPYRTGGWVVVRAEALARVLDEATTAKLLRTRWSFVPDAAWAMLGLPAPGEAAEAQGGA
jgi:hypothetical protein